MRGHGRSDKPDTAAAHVSARYADDFAAVSKAFNLNKPVFVGWSVINRHHHDCIFIQSWFYEFLCTQESCGYVSYNIDLSLDAYAIDATLYSCYHHRHCRQYRSHAACRCSCSRWKSRDQCKHHSKHRKFLALEHSASVQ